ncbi:MAG: hypothetical protein J6U51_09065 [Bacteroidales bacterium]|nr:hypothetical protein [Bacteroidales bacterium]
MIIIKYFEWLKLFKDERYPIYELCNKKYEKVRQLSREDARRMIKDNHLRMVYFDANGAIWET